MLEKEMNRNAFTLIELLIVVAIIGILAAIAVPNFLNAQLKARIARTYAEQRATSSALEQYYLDWNSYVEDHDYPSTKSQRGLFRLTSPLPYMASLPVDVFASERINNFSEGNPNYEFGSGNGSTPGKQWPATAYLIISPGPNLAEEVSGNDNFPHGTTIRSYDISNGLNTSGDIVRMGGQYSSGTIVVDGKYLYGGSPRRP